MRTDLYYEYGNLPVYRHYLTVGSSTTEVFPLNFLASSLVDELENNQVFYRRKFNGSLSFVNNNSDDDFTLLSDIDQTNPCDKLLYNITKNGDYYWDGYFSTTSGKFDFDRCTFEVTPLPNDDYAPILDNQDLHYDILTIATVVTTHAIVPTKMNVTYTRNRWLMDVIEFLADKVSPGVTVSSEFFTAGTNYVTLAANKLTHLTIAQKSDIIRPTSSEPAGTASMSWKELTDILWTMFQVRWTYSSGVINLEHISWFSQSLGVDIRTQLLTQGTNKYTYAKEEMPKYEKFYFMESYGEDFVGTPIYYESACVNQDPDSNSRELSINVTTDLYFIYSEPDAIADEGFVILDNYLDTGSYYVRLFYSLYGPPSINGELGWVNLHNSYFRHERVLIQGYMNRVLQTFYTALKTKKQTCSVIYCDFNSEENITTELGETYLGGVKAKVERATLSPNGRIDLNLQYGPIPNTNTGVEPVETIWILSNDTDIYFTLSHASAIDLYFWVLIDGTTCQEIVIAAGLTYYTVALADSGTLEFNILDPSISDWQLFWNDGDPIPEAAGCPAEPPTPPPATIIVSIIDDGSDADFTLWEGAGSVVEDYSLIDIVLVASYTGYSEGQEKTIGYTITKNGSAAGYGGITFKSSESNVTSPHPQVTMTGTATVGDTIVITLN